MNEVAVFLGDSGAWERSKLRKDVPSEKRPQVGLNHSILYQQLKNKTHCSHNFCFCNFYTFLDFICKHVLRKTLRSLQFLRKQCLKSASAYLLNCFLYFQLLATVYYFQPLAIAFGILDFQLAFCCFQPIFCFQLLAIVFRNLASLAQLDFCHLNFLARHLGLLAFSTFRCFKFSSRLLRLLAFSILNFQLVFCIKSNLCEICIVKYLS